MKVVKSVLRFLLDLVVGTLCCLITIPMMVIGAVFIIAARTKTAEWWIDHSPLMLWLDYVEYNKW